MMTFRPYNRIHPSPTFLPLLVTLSFLVTIINQFLHSDRGVYKEHTPEVPLVHPPLDAAPIAQLLPGGGSLHSCTIVRTCKESQPRYPPPLQVLNIHSSLSVASSESFSRATITARSAARSADTYIKPNRSPPKGVQQARHPTTTKIFLYLVECSLKM